MESFTNIVYVAMVLWQSVAEWWSLLSKLAAIFSFSQEKEEKVKWSVTCGFAQWYLQLKFNDLSCQTGFEKNKKKMFGEF